MNIIKRNGSVVPFDKVKIENAINKAFLEVDGILYETETAKDIADDIEKYNLKENEIEEIEDELIRLNSFEKTYNFYKNFEENYQNASQYLYQAKKDLSHISDDIFEKETSKFDELYYELEDTVDNIKSIFSSLENSRDRIDYLTSRKLELAPLRNFISV